MTAFELPCTQNKSSHEKLRNFSYFSSTYRYGKSASVILVYWQVIAIKNECSV